MLRYDKSKMITLRIIPDRTVDNKVNYKLLRVLHDLYVPPMARLGVEKWGLVYRPQVSFWYDVILTQKEIRYYFTIPELWEGYIKQKITGCWPRVAIERCDPEETKVPEENTALVDLQYKRHNMFSLRTDRAEDTQPIGGIMRTSCDMKENDLTRLAVRITPANRLDWNESVEKAYNQFLKGITPHRNGLNGRKILLGIGQQLDYIFNSLGRTLLICLGHEDNKKKDDDLEKREILLDGKLDRATLSKKTEPIFKTAIRIAAHSADPERREINARAVANAFVDLAGDNELERVSVGKVKKIKVNLLYELNTHSTGLVSRLDFDANIMSAGELGKIAQLPSAGLQDEFTEQLTTIKLRQTDIPLGLLNDKGLYLGAQNYRNKELNVYMPVNDYDELCLPNVTIGGMGCGKTKGFGANWAVEAVRKGFGCLVIDPAKREMGAVIRGVLPADKVIHYDLSKHILGLDWREVLHGPRAKNRLANTLIAFFNMSGDDMAQTERHLRAAVSGMETGRLSEIIRIFEDDVYRQKIIKGLPDGLNKMTLEGYGKESDGRKRQIIAPIYNRLNTILSDDYLAQGMETEDGLDMVDILSQKKAVIIDIPGAYFDPIQTDIIVNLLAIKIDLAMRLRAEKNQFPFFVIFDEPHSYLRSASLWKAAAIESRKWRLGYVWLFHSWEQIPRDLAEIIKAAGPHYHLYASSPKTYKDLSVEIAPITTEEAAGTPRYYAINVLRTGGITVKPVILKMAPPPKAVEKLQKRA